MAIRPSETDVTGSEQFATTVPGSADPATSRSSSEPDGRLGATVAMDATDFAQTGRGRGSQLIREKL
jgi:hypothetical protein